MQRNVTNRMEAGGPKSWEHDGTSNSELTRLDKSLEIFFSSNCSYLQPIHIIYEYISLDLGTSVYCLARGR